MRVRVRMFAGLVVVAAAIGASGCGGDDDGGDDPAKQQPAAQESSDTRAAERLEAYLERRMPKVSGIANESGQVISHVEPKDGRLKIWTFLNAEIPAQSDHARTVCRLAKASGVPEAKGAVVVDPGDAEIRRC